MNFESPATMSSVGQERDQETDQALDELRALLLKPEQQRLEQLTRRLDDPLLHARDVSRALPKALALCAREDNRLATALQPMMEEVLRVAVKRDVRAFADALFPVMGPAIRRSIAETLRGMLQSLNAALEHSLSWRGLKWRLESLRSGRPFSEIVLLHSLVYRVEQLFLIHRESGLLLQHLSNDPDVHQDAELVSGMLTAIRDFSRDSFDVAAEDPLHSIRIADLSLWVEQGPELILAAAIRGTPPEGLRQLFRSTLEEIHLSEARAIADFAGDGAAFEGTRPLLEQCLRSRRRERSRRLSPRLWVLPAALLAALGWWLFDDLRARRQWDDYLQRLRSEPGIVIAATDEYDGVHRLRGLRDPLARTPRELLEGTGVAPQRVEDLLVPYQALIPRFVLARARRILAPPEGLALELEGARLVARGRAPAAWLQEARRLAPVLPGIEEFDSGAVQALVDLTPLAAPAGVSLTREQGLITARGHASHAWITRARALAPTLPGVRRYDDGGLTIDPDLSSLEIPETVSAKVDRGVLRVSGRASRAWILRARGQAETIPGITAYRDDQLIDTDLERLRDLAQRLEQEVILFDVNLADAAADDSGWQRIHEMAAALLAGARKAGRQVVIELIGHSDSSGTERHRRRISRRRAEYVQNLLVAAGIPRASLKVRAVGSDEPLQEEVSEQEKRMNRSVSFRVELGEPDDGPLS